MAITTEQRIRQILSSTPAIIYTCRADGDFSATFVSDNFSYRFGYASYEFLNQANFWENNIHPDDKDRVLDAYEELFLKGYHSHEYRFRKKNGDYLWVHDELQLICNDDGSPLEIVGSWLDITDRKETEDALRKSEDLFREFFESNPIPVIITSLDGVVLNANLAFLESGGFLKNEVVGISSLETFWQDPTDRDVMTSALQEKGYINNFQCTFYDKAKNPRHCLLSSRAFEVGGEMKILSTLIDVTEKIRAEAALRKSEQLFKDFFTSNPIATIISSADGQIHMVNAAFTKTTGYRSDEVVGRTAQEMKFWRDPEDRDRMVSAVQAQGYLDNFESNFYGKNNLPMTCLISSRLITHEEETRILSIVIDVSVQRKAEREMKRLEKAKSDFISIAAHELRTPLIAIVGYCELLENAAGFTLSEDTKQEYLDIIHSNAEVLNGLVNDLLDMGRIQIGRKLGITRKETELLPLIKKIVASVELKSPHHKLITEPAEGLPKYIWVDAGRISQVLHNILNNAIKFSPEGGEVKVGMDTREGWVTISVADRGIGMSTEQVEKVFDQFYSVDTGNSQPHGLGVGLSVTKQIVADHGGDIVVESQLGKGTTVTLKLPMRE